MSLILAKSTVSEQPPVSSLRDLSRIHHVAKPLAEAVRQEQGLSAVPWMDLSPDERYRYRHVGELAIRCCDTEAWHRARRSGQRAVEATLETWMVKHRLPRAHVELASIAEELSLVLALRCQHELLQGRR